MRMMVIRSSLTISNKKKKKESEQRSITMPFTPIESIAGGLIMGAGVCFHSIFLGRITDASNALHSTIMPLKARDQPREWLWKFMYILGVAVASSVILGHIPYFASLAFNSSYPWKRIDGLYAFLTHPLVLFPVAGFTVGSSMFFTDGCTSSHMLWGLSALRIRSIIAASIFALTAFIMSKLFRTVDNVMSSYEPGSISGATPFIVWPTAFQTILLITMVVGVYAMYFSLWAMAEGWSRRNYRSISLEEHPALFNALSFLNGAVFTTGMGISGMTKPQKVLGVFDIFGPWFDPSLLFVAITAIGINLIANYTYTMDRNTSGETPVFAKEFQFGTSEPPLSALMDWRLTVGSLIFGFGWGLTGLSPGSVISAFTGTGNGEMVIFFASMAAAMVIQSLVSLITRGHPNIAGFKSSETDAFMTYERMNEMEFNVPSGG